MRLELTNEIPGYLSGVAVKDVVACRVFFLLTGRNSWHGNWSSRYAESSSFHSSLVSAQLEAEPRRTQGTRFSIFERPAIRMLTDAGKLVAIHINNSQPFADWRARPPAGGWWRPRYTLDRTTDAGTLMAALKIESGHWDARPGENERVLFVAAPAGLPFLFLAGSKLRAWSSTPMGIHRNLGWRQFENRIAPKGAYQAAGLMTRQLHLGSRRARMAS